MEMLSFWAVALIQYFSVLVNPVFNPVVNYLPQEDSLTFWQNVKSAYSRYINKFINLSRTRLGLTNIINTDSFVIKKETKKQVS